MDGAAPSASSRARPLTVGPIDLEELSTEEHGYTVNDEDEDEPILLDRDGNPVETWREDYPYDENVIVFEGRDAADRGEE